MKKLIIALLGLFVFPVSVPAQTTNAEANANTNSRVNDSARIDSLEARADETDSEQTVQDNRLDALEAGSGQPQAPNWVLYTRDEVSGDFKPDPNIHVLQYPSNQSEATASLLLRITTVSGREVWFPGVWAGTNSIVTPTWQGTYAAKYTVLGYPAGSGCVGDPTALVLRTNDPGKSAFKTNVSRFFLAFDPRTGIIWRPATGGGSTFDGDTYDVYEYGLEKGWLPVQTSTACRTIIVGTTPEYPGNGRTLVLEDPIHFAQTPYIYDNVTPKPARTIAPTGSFQ